MLGFGEWVVLVFVPNADEAFMAEAMGALRIFSLSFLVRWLPFATQAYMMAVEQARAASIVSVGQALVIPLLVVAALWPLGLTGLWLNMPVSAGLAAILSCGVLVVFRRTVRERMERA